MYIIDQKKYFNYFNRGIGKLIPKRIVPVIRPKIIDYVYDQEGNILGNIAGVFLKEPASISDLVEKFITAIKKLRDENTQIMLIDNLHIFNRSELDIIEKETRIKVIDGVALLIDFLSVALYNINRFLDADLKSKEALIMGDDEELTIKAIESICKNIGFITIAGDYKKESIDRIYQHILEKTGLSIFYSKSIDKILINYSIIINLIDNCSLNINKIRNDAIIFDLSIDKQFSNRLKQNTNLTAIEDLIFKGDDANINTNPFIPELIPSHIYTYFGEPKTEDFYGIYAGGQIYTLEEFMNLKIKKKGKL